MDDNELPGMWEALDFSGGWADTENDRQQKANERRERYAAAIRDIFGGLPYVAVLIERAARAAIAMADEEIRSVQDAWCAATRMIRASNARLRAELEDVKRKHENFKKGSDAGGKEMRKRLSEAEDTISRVRAVLDDWRNGDVHYPFLAVRDALNGEDK